MIHYRQGHGWSPGTCGSETPSRHRDLLAAVEASTAAVRRARQAADESLRRAQAAPEPHETTNTIFVFLYEEHLRDREALFAALRDLDKAQAALRDVAAGPRVPGEQDPS